MKREASALTEPEASVPFRASLFLFCLLHAEADLKLKKDFKEATLRTHVAGACSLALVRCGKTAFSALGKDSEVMTEIRNACSGDSPQDVKSLFFHLEGDPRGTFRHSQGDQQDRQRWLQDRRWFI
jgi:hypothetical protein